MCVIEQRTYIQPNGKKETFEHVKSRCLLAGTGKACRQVTYEERTMPGAGHSLHPPNVRYVDESSSPATESFPPTPVNEATIVEVRPSSSASRPQPSPKSHRKSGSLGRIYFNFGSKKEKKKERVKAYHGSSANSEATSSSSVRSFSPAPISPHDGPSHQHSHQRSYSATMPTKPAMSYSTSARTPTTPDSRGREEVHWLSSQPHADLHTSSLQARADPPMGPPGPPRPPAPPAPADPPSPEESGRRRARRPPPIVTQSSHSSEYRTASAAPSRLTNISHHTSSDAAQVASDREFAEKLSASLNNLRMGDDSAHPPETEEDRQARIECERAEGRARLRQERQADEYWANYHRNREQRREEGRRMNREQRISADWETQLEEGRRRLQQQQSSLHPEERHNPTVDDAAPDQSSGDDDWQTQLEEGRRRLAELKRTETSSVNRQSTRDRHGSHAGASSMPHRSNTTGGSGQRLPGRPTNVRFENVSSTSSSSANATTGTSSSSGFNAPYDEDAERRRLYAFERAQMERERTNTDAMLASQIADAQADIARAEARLADRKDRERRERLVEGQYDAYTYDMLNGSAPHAGDFYNPRLGMRGTGVGSSRPVVAHGGVPTGESGWERGQRVIHEARGGGGGGRRSRRPSSSHAQRPRPEGGYYGV